LSQGSSSKLKKIERAQACRERARNAAHYCEDGYETELEAGEESECEASTEEDSGDQAREWPHGQAMPNRQNRNPARHRDGPVTAENITVADWERVEAIAVDAREGIVQKGLIGALLGALLGERNDTLSHAQKFFPLGVFEPLVPHDAKATDSPLSGMPEITMSFFVGWLAMWVAMMGDQPAWSRHVLEQPARSHLQLSRVS
jgi:hypothetical protein